MTDEPRPLFESLNSPGALRDLMLQAAGEQRQAARRLLRNRAVRRLARRLVDNARQRVDQGTSESPLAVLRACGAGCSACCWTPVIDVTALEAIVVGAQLRYSLSEAQLQQAHQRIAANARQREAMSPEDRQGLRIRCALLGDDGLCSVYSARPLVCAGVFSLSRTACESASHAPAGEANIPLDQPAKAWAMGVSGGLQHALVDAGLDGNLYELHGAVLRVLDIPDAFARWLRREDVFRGCLCTDAHSPPRIGRRLRIDSPNAKVAKPHVETNSKSPTVTRTAARRHRQE